MEGRELLDDGGERHPNPPPPLPLPLPLLPATNVEKEEDDDEDSIETMTAGCDDAVVDHLSSSSPLAAYSSLPSQSQSQSNTDHPLPPPQSDFKLRQPLTLLVVFASGGMVVVVVGIGCVTAAGIGGLTDGTATTADGQCHPCLSTPYYYYYYYYGGNGQHHHQLKGSVKKRMILFQHMIGDTDTATTTPPSYIGNSTTTCDKGSWALHSLPLSTNLDGRQGGTIQRTNSSSKKKSTRTIGSRRRRLGTTAATFKSWKRRMVVFPSGNKDIQLPSSKKKKARARVILDVLESSNPTTTEDVDSIDVYVRAMDDEQDHDAMGVGVVGEDEKENDMEDSSYITAEEGGREEEGSKRSTLSMDLFSSGTTIERSMGSSTREVLL